jgi:hypothetical protein
LIVKGKNMNTPNSNLRRSHKTPALVSRSTLVLGLTVCFFLNSHFSASAQGSLTPPGAPAPTMKTLDQVEPRIPIGTNTTPGDFESLFRITAPGSYYLTTNILGVAGRHGIKIASSGVTLDLMGFELVGVAGSLNGVRVSLGGTNLVVQNGTIRNWDDSGVHATLARNGRFEKLHAASNGDTLEEHGLHIGSASAPGNLILHCSVEGNAGDGINVGAASIVHGCIAVQNGRDGISGGAGSVVTDCTANGNIGSGIVTLLGSSITSCMVRANGENGISAASSSTIRDCTAVFNSGNGIQIAARCLVVGNNCAGNGIGAADGAGIHATGTANRIDSNLVTASDRGIDVDFAFNLIIRNSANGNTINYDIVANNKVGVIVSAPLSGAISGSTGGAGVGTSDPWANLSY